MTLTIVALAVVVLFVFALLPKSANSNSILPVIERPEVNLRTQQIDEEAEMIATEYRDYARQKFRDHVRAKTADMLFDPDDATEDA